MEKKIKIVALKQTQHPLDTKLVNACDGKAAGKNGLNLKDFRRALKNAFPAASAAVDAANSRKDVEALCKKLMAGKKVVTPEPVEVVYHELPKQYCEDYTLEELTARAGRNVRLTSDQRDQICQELGLTRYNPINEESLGYPRARILAIAKKIESGTALDQGDQRIVQQWNQNHDPIKERLDNLANRFVSGERLNEADLKFLDQELFNKYCRCLLKRKKQDAELFATRNLEAILQKLPDQSMDRATAIVVAEKGQRDWNSLSDAEKDSLLAKLMPIFLGLSIGGCKSSVYQKSRKIKPRNRECDDVLRQAEISLENR